MKKLIKLNAGTIVLLTALSYIAYYILMRDNFLHSSIASIIAHSHHLEVKKHLLVLGLLPIYIAAIIFGTAMLAVYLGTALQHFLHKSVLVKNK